MPRALRTGGGALAALLLAACSPGGASGDEALPGDPLACALAGAEAFAMTCTGEVVKTDGIVTLVVRHPDGAFRRFDVLEDGRGLAVADGAQQAVIRYGAEHAEVVIGRDRYRVPVTLQDRAEASAGAAPESTGHAAAR